MSKREEEKTLMRNMFEIVVNMANTVSTVTPSEKAAARSSSSPKKPNKKTNMAPPKLKLLIDY